MLIVTLKLIGPVELRVWSQVRVRSEKPSVEKRFAVITPPPICFTPLFELFLVTMSASRDLWLLLIA